MVDSALVWLRAQCGIAAGHLCTGCGEIKVRATIPGLSSIPQEKIREAALELANFMETIPESEMIDDDSITVRCNGKVKFKLKTLDDQSNEDERWDEEYQPFTTAKAVAHNARVLLNTWQTSMLFEHRKDTKQTVFVAEDLDSLEQIVRMGEKERMLQAIRDVRTARIEQLDAKLRY